METVKHVHAIEYRNKTEPPIDEGWYYGRISKGPIQPVYVYRDTRVRDELVTPPITGISDDLYYTPLCWLDWYGPVAECREG